jgi:membrane protease YdiL (CAAX protease family)
MRQDELLQEISDETLKKALILSQFTLLLLSIILSIFLFDHFLDWYTYFHLNIKEIIYYGMIPGLIIVVIDLILLYSLPKQHLDDGGLNQRIFQNRSITEIFFLTIMIAVCEEVLFRGVLQTTFGYIIASVVFALVHLRYLKKPVLLASTLLISFYIGYLFEITGNLMVTITAHFIIDFLLGLMIRFQKWGTVN